MAQFVDPPMHSAPSFAPFPYDDEEEEKSAVFIGIADEEVKRSLKSTPQSKATSKLKKCVVDCYWTEKALLIFDMMQIYGLVWICAQPWPWPYLWIIWTRWAVVFNVDVFSLYPDGALAGRTNNIGISRFGELNGYLYYALGFAMVELAVILSTLYLMRKTKTYAQRWQIYRPWIVGTAGYLAMVFYLPCTLVLFRLYACEVDGALSADRNVLCGDVEHVAISAVCSLIHLPVIVWLPWWLYSCAEELSVYDLNPDHEKRIQMWEILYLEDICDDFIENQCWVIASFKLNGVYFRFHMALLKLGLVSVFVGCQRSLSLQAVLCLILVSTFYGFYGLYRETYRCSTSSWMLTVAAVVLIVDTAFGFANSLGIHNFLMVASTESIVLLCVNGVGACGFILITSFSLFSSQIRQNCGIKFDILVGQWPACRTLHNLRHNPRTNSLCVQWMDALRKAREVKVAAFTASDALLDVDGLEYCLRQLRQQWLSASAVGSIFSLALSEAMEELLHLHAKLKPRAFRTRSHWDDAYVSLVEKRRFEDRHNSLVLMSDRKRRILTKLLAMRSLLSGSKDRREAERAKARIYSVKQVQQIGPSTYESRYTSPLLSLLNETEVERASENMDRTVQFINDLTIRSDVFLSRAQARVEGHDEWMGEMMSLITAWDEAISVLEGGSLPGLHDHFSDVDAENWYTFRAALTDLYDHLDQQSTAVSKGSEFNGEEPYSARDDDDDDSHVEQPGDRDANDELDRLLGIKTGWNQHPLVDPSDNNHHYGISAV
jgi:hypothetical protein